MSTPFDSTSPLRAGAAQVDITPPLGSLIGVDFLRHYARFIHDSLYAKALVLEKQGYPLALVVVDICIMPSDLMTDIKERVQQATGIPPEQVMLSCTHTHGAGDVAGLLGGAVDIAYRTLLPDRIVDAVLQAQQRLRPARVASGAVAVPEHVLCRRYVMKEGYVACNPITGAADLVKTNPAGAESYIERPAAPVDPNLGFLAVKGTDDRWIAVLGNYGLHYVGDWDVDTITADYYGEFARQIRQKLTAGDDFVGMMTYSTGGDINIWDFVRPGRYPNRYFAKTKLIAHDLSERVAQALEQVAWQDASLAVAYQEVELSVRKPSDEDLRAATRTLMENDLTYLEVDEHGMQVLYAREQLLLNEYPDIHTAAVQAIRIGDLVIGASGGELFAETGRRLKDQLAGLSYFTVCLANTYDGYVPPAHEMARGGYETWRARSSFLSDDSEEVLRRALLKLVQKITHPSTPA